MHRHGRVSYGSRLGLSRGCYFLGHGFPGSGFHKHQPDQVHVFRKALLVLYRRRPVPVAPPVGQVQAKQLAQEGRAFRLAKVAQEGFDLWPQIFSPGVFKALANAVDPLPHSQRKRVSRSELLFVHGLSSSAPSAPWRKGVSCSPLPLPSLGSLGREGLGVRGLPFPLTPDPSRPRETAEKQTTDGTDNTDKNKHAVHYRCGLRFLRLQRLGGLRGVAETNFRNRLRHRALRRQSLSTVCF